MSNYDLLSQSISPAKSEGVKIDFKRVTYRVLRIGILWPDVWAFHYRSPS